MQLRLIRKDNGETITLPADLRWIDEHDWHAIAQAAPQRTLSGSLIIQQAQKRGGRAITLSADYVWVSRETVQKLRDWTDTPELTLRYTHYDGREFDVLFALHDTPLKAEPVRFAAPETADDAYTVTLKLMTV